MSAKANTGGKTNDDKKTEPKSMDIECETGETGEPRDTAPLKKWRGTMQVRQLAVLVVEMAGLSPDSDFIDRLMERLEPNASMDEINAILAAMTIQEQPKQSK